MPNKTNLYDATRCTACRGCQVACKNWNQNPAWIEPFKGNYQTHEDTNSHTFTIINMNETEDGMGVKWYFSKRQCMHCMNAACIKVCPRGALSRNKWGAVIKDYDKCIGCQYCANACPFEIPKYDDRRDVVTKCTLCAERVDTGLTPACAKTCPAGALQFGDREELLVIARQRVAFLRANGNPNANIYGESELGGLNKLYVLGDTPDKYGLPVNPKIRTSIYVWQNVLQPWLILLPAVALAGSATSFITTRLLANQKAKYSAHHEEEV
ncbi:MAG: 4Fe-4S dicluster domain-containing protein [Ignavibacteriales bacterium]